MKCFICGKDAEEKNCVLCQNLINTNYFACIGIDPKKSEFIGDKLKTSGAYRTGLIMWVFRESIKKLFKIEIDATENYCFIDDKILKKITDGNRNVKNFN